MRTENYNLEIIEELVSTKYNDFGGYIQVDGHNPADLSKLCEDHGIKMDKYFLISFGMGESTIDGIGRNDEVYCRAILLETKIYGNSFDEICEKIKELNGYVKAKQIHFNVKYKTLYKYIKRYDFVVASKLTKYISNMELDSIT